MVRCHEVREHEVSQVIDLLTEGFQLDRNYWIAAMQSLLGHPTPSGYPKYGYAIEDDGKIVGVVLLISTGLTIDGELHVRSNVSSWYVLPQYRTFGSILSMRVLKHKNSTIFNVSPAVHTWTILEKQGFERFASGRCFSLPVLSRAPKGCQVREVEANIQPGPDLPAFQIQILLDHRSYGCLSLTCEHDGQRYPFVFGLHRRHGILPVAHLVYCRTFDDFARFAGAIGRALARRGFFFVIFDANGPVREIVSHYFGGRPRYRKGGDQIRIGDVAYSEQVLFGY